MRYLGFGFGAAVVCVVLVSAGWLLGDDKKPDDKKGDDTKATANLPPHYKALGLSDDQIKKVKTVQATYKSKIDDLEQKIKDLKAEEKLEREKILTDDQKTRLKQLLLGEKDQPKDKPADKAKDK